MSRRTIPLPFLLGLLAFACSPPGCERGDGCASVEALREYRPPEATRVFAADGSVLADLSPQRRVVLPLDAIPAHVRDAFVAVEDRRFWRHNGVDRRAILRAAWRDVTSLSFREGFSTLTMQLARNLFPEALPRTKLVRRKLWEIHFALRIERQLSKREILELYLNQIYLGSGYYGVEAAARGYFGRPASRLGPAETATLVALARSPEGYNPRRHPDRALARRNVVLGVMAREGVIPPEVATTASEEPLGLAPPLEAAGPAPYYVAAVRRELGERYGPDADVMGLRVHTALDPALQKAAHDALTRQIEGIEAGRYGRYPHATPNGDRPDTADAGASPYLQGMLVAVSPETGDILALVGGRDFAHSQFDRASQARRQPGSAFKPIVYAAALEQGLTLASRIDATPVLVTDAAGGPWRPADTLGDTVPVLTVRQAVAHSSNFAAVRVGRWVGEGRVAEVARRLGITTPVPPYPSIHLGSAEVVPLELVLAYAAFANGGFRVEPRLITRVEDANGRVLWEATRAPTRVLDEGVAFLAVDMLKSVVDDGTGRAVRGAGFALAAAGKTGTSNEGRDVWFLGMTPDIAAGVWIGFDRPQRIMPGASGGRLAAPAWAAFMTEAYASRPAPGDWSPGAAVVGVEVDAESGYLATGRCPAEHVRTEYFLPGTEPYRYCPYHPESAAERFLRRLWRGVRGVL